MLADFLGSQGPGAQTRHTLHPQPVSGAAGEFGATSHWPPCHLWTRMSVLCQPLHPAASPSWARDQDVQGQEEQKMSCCANTAQGLGKTQSPVQYRRSAWFPQAHCPAAVRPTPPLSTGRRVKTSSGAAQMHSETQQNIPEILPEIAGLSRVLVPGRRQGITKPPGLACAASGGAGPREQ